MKPLFYDLEDHVRDALTLVPPHTEPFPWFYAQNVFPRQFYDLMLRELDAKTNYEIGDFANRAFSNLEDGRLPELAFLKSVDFLKFTLGIFNNPLVDRFGVGKHKFTRDIRLVRDQQHYKIGPHTDAPWKVVSLLFYLPRDDSLRDYGTALYVPRDPAFTCEGGPHYPFEPREDVSPGFREVWRAPFLPNTCLGFFKTNKSFHGVPPIPVPVRRDVLLYNIYTEEPGAT